MTVKKRKKRKKRNVKLLILRSLHSYRGLPLSARELKEDHGFTDNEFNNAMESMASEEGNINYPGDEYEGTVIQTKRNTFRLRDEGLDGKYKYT